MWSLISTETVKQDLGTEPIQRENSAKPDDGNSDTFMFEIIKGEVVKITDKREIVSTEGVE